MINIEEQMYYIFVLLFDLLLVGRSEQDSHKS